MPPELRRRSARLSTLARKFYGQNPCQNTAGCAVLVVRCRRRRGWIDNELRATGGVDHQHGAGRLAQNRPGGDSGSISSSRISLDAAAIETRYSAGSEMTLRDLLEAELKAAEGLRLMVYDDATSSILKPGKV